MFIIIPQITTEITPSKIKQIFKNEKYGIVEQVYIKEKKNNYGLKYYTSYIYCSKWFDNPRANYVKKTLLSGDMAIIEYEINNIFKIYLAKTLTSNLIFYGNCNNTNNSLKNKYLTWKSSSSKLCNEQKQMKRIKTNNNLQNMSDNINIEEYREKIESQREYIKSLTINYNRKKYELENMEQKYSSLFKKHNSLLYVISTLENDTSNYIYKLYRNELEHMSQLNKPLIQTEPKVTFSENRERLNSI